MRIPDLLFSDGWLWFCWLAWSALLGWALLHCPWARLRDPQQQHTLGCHSIVTVVVEL